MVVRWQSFVAAIVALVGSSVAGVASDSAVSAATACPISDVVNAAPAHPAAMAPMALPIAITCTGGPTASTPVLVVGEVLLSGVPMSGATWEVFVNPVASVWAAAASGTSIQSVLVASGTTGADGTFEAWLDPSTLTSSYLDSSDDADVEVTAQDSNGSNDQEFEAEFQPGSNTWGTVFGDQDSLTGPGQVAFDMNPSSPAAAEAHDPAAPVVEGSGFTSATSNPEGDSAATLIDTDDPQDTYLASNALLEARPSLVPNGVGTDLKAPNATFSDGATEMDNGDGPAAYPGCVWIATGLWKTLVDAKWGAMHGWAGAKMTVTQTVGASSEMGIGEETQAGGYFAADSTEKVSADITHGTTSPPMTNMWIHNQYNYEHFQLYCSGFPEKDSYEWRALQYAALNDAYTTASPVNYKACSVVVVGTKYFTQTKKASTVTDGVDLLGVFNLSAQSGWNSSVFLEWIPTQPTLTCGGSSHGWVQSANIENKSDN
jgi:hypothetical protein